MMSITTASSRRGSETGERRSVDRTATTGGSRRTRASTDLANVAKAAYKMHWHIHAVHIGGFPVRSEIICIDAFLYTPMRTSEGSIRGC